MLITSWLHGEKIRSILFTTRNMAPQYVNEDTITLSEPSTQKVIYTGSSPALEEFLLC